MAKKSFGTNEPCNIDYELCDEGAFRLAQAILEQTACDYRSALKKRERLTKKYLEIKDDYEAWYKYVDLRKKYNACKNKIYRTPEEREVINAFKDIKVAPRQLNATEKLNVSRFFENEALIIECEMFYKSEGYKRLTLGSGLNGEEVIERVRNSINKKRPYRRRTLKNKKPA